MSSESILKTNLDGILPFVARGKVREIWKIDEEKLLFVATDRISGACNSILIEALEYRATDMSNTSAYDVILQNVRRVINVGL